MTVTEMTPGDAIFRYQALVNWRTYRFEVTDMDGFTLASCDREMRTSIKIHTYAGSGQFDLKNEHTAALWDGDEGEIYITDDGYDSNPYGQDFKDHRYLSVDSSAFYDAGIQGYFAATGAQLRMTLSLMAKEYHDGYQYIQILTDNTSSCDNRKDCKNGDPGNISLSRYMAGFEIDTGSTYTGTENPYKKFTFPVLSAGNGEGAANPWGHGKTFPLSKQKFNRNCRASDGRLILPADFQTLVVRLNASGSGEDNWKTNNVSATVAAVDETAPYALNNRITVSPGPYSIGADFYVSVPFSELMEYGTKLNTSWGQAVLDGTCTGSNHGSRMNYKIMK